MLILLEIFFRISDIFSEKAILSNPQSAVNSQQFYKALINKHLEFMRTDDKIRKIRLDKGFSHESMAYLLGISPSV
jgi:hypothetical protein